MRYAAAYLLAILGGNSAPDVDAIGKILGSVGIECDRKKAQNVINACQGRSVNELISEGMEKMGQLPVSTTSVETDNSAKVDQVEKPKETTASPTHSTSSSPLFFDDEDMVSDIDFLLIELNEFLGYEFVRQLKSKDTDNCFTRRRSRLLGRYFGFSFSNKNLPMMVTINDHLT